MLYLVDKVEGETAGGSGLIGSEDTVRLRGDRIFEAAGWVLQDVAQCNRNAALGVAVREFSLPSGPCDYVLFIDGKAFGVIAPKPAASP